MQLDDLKILICDDSILARKQMKDIINSIGSPTIIEAANGQLAIDMYKEHKPNLTFIDIVMPVKDGNAAISEIMEYDSSATIFVASSVGTQSELKKALAATCAASQVFSAKSIRTLGNLYLDHEDEFEKLRKHCGSRIEYPAAKILDMCFFEYGFQRDASSQEDSD